MEKKGVICAGITPPEEPAICGCRGNLCCLQHQKTAADKEAKLRQLEEDPVGRLCQNAADTS